MNELRIKSPAHAESKQVYNQILDFYKSGIKRKDIQIIFEFVCDEPKQILDYIYKTMNRISFQLDRLN